MRIPIFPLGTVLVPGLVMPLHIFEPRYVALVEMLLERSDPQDREFGLSTARPESRVEDEGCAALFPVGTLALLKEAEHLPDGRLNILVVGTRRFVHLDVDTADPLAYADVELLDETLGDLHAPDASRAGALFRTYRRTLSEVLGIRVNAAHEIDGEISTEPFDAGLPDDPGLLSHLITAAAILPLHERAALLAAPDIASRLAMASALLRRECAVITHLPSLPTLDLASAGMGGN